MCDETTVCEAVEFHSERWRERHKALHVPEHEKISLSNEDKVNYERHVKLHPIAENEASTDAVRSWSNKARQFRASAKDAKQ